MPNRTKEQLRNEINDCKHDLEQWIGRPVRMFSCPNGSFDNRVGPRLAEAGYSPGVTTENHPLTLGDDRYYIPRFSVMDDGRMLSENVCHAFGLWQRVMEVLEVSKLIRRNADSDRIEHAHFTA